MAFRMNDLQIAGNGQYMLACHFDLASGVSSGLTGRGFASITDDDNKGSGEAEAYTLDFSEGFSGYDVVAAVAQIDDEAVNVAVIDVDMSAKQCVVKSDTADADGQVSIMLIISGTMNI